MVSAARGCGVAPPELGQGERLGPDAVRVLQQLGRGAVTRASGNRARCEQLGQASRVSASVEEPIGGLELGQQRSRAGALFFDQGVAFGSRGGGDGFVERLDPGAFGAPQGVVRVLVADGRHEARPVPRLFDHAREAPQGAQAPVDVADDQHAEHLAALTATDDLARQVGVEVRLQGARRSGGERVRVALAKRRGKDRR